MASEFSWKRDHTEENESKSSLFQTAQCDSPVNDQV